MATGDIDSEQTSLFDTPVNRIAMSRAVPPERPAPIRTYDDDISMPPMLGEATRTAASAREALVRSANRAPSKGRGETVEGAMGLFAVYAMILFAVPTLGVAAAVGLVAVTTRPRPVEAVARSHFEFQKRTLWIAAVAAVLGGVLIAVSFIGVVALFIVAVWLLARGTWGLLLLARGAPVTHPRQWLIAAG